MKKINYKRLNDYLNDAFIYLSENDGFFIQNMDNIFPLNSILYENLKDIDLRHNFHKNNLTYEDVFNLARNEIEKINPNYLEDFDKLIESGRLEFFLHEQNMIIKGNINYENLSEIENNEEEIRNDSVCSYNNGDYFIDLARTHNYNDVLKMIDIDLTDENINEKLVDSAQNYYESLSKYSVKEEKEKSLTYNV